MMNQVTPKTAKGFTLIELIIVIIILTILLAAALLSWPGREINLNAQTHQLENDIRYTQNLALSKGVRYKLIRLDATSYRIESIDTTPTIATTVHLDNGITFANFPNNLIAFNTKGIPYATDTLPGTALTTPLQITLTAEGKTRSVFVTPETGEVHL